MSSTNTTTPDDRYNLPGTPRHLRVFLDPETEWPFVGASRRLVRVGGGDDVDVALDRSYDDWFTEEHRRLGGEIDTALDYYGLSPNGLVVGSPAPSEIEFRRALDPYKRSRCVSKNKETDLLHWRCERNSCEDCVELNTFSIGGAILWSRPWAFFTINKVPYPWVVTRPWMDRFKQWLQKTLTLRLGHPAMVSWAWTVERYPWSGEGVHVHGYLHPIPGVATHDLKTIMESYTWPHGAEDVYLRPVEQAPEATGTYITKALKLSQRGLIEAEVEDEIADYFWLNGKNIIHATNGRHGFIRDCGEPITLAQGRSLAIERYRGWRRGRIA